MKKLNTFLFTIALFVFVFPFISVQAASLNVKTIQASITDNKISVSGTVDNGVLAVAILVYEEDGTTLVTMKTTSVDSNDKYSDIIEVTSGKKYIVKSANYAGGTYVTAEVDGSIKNNNNNNNNNASSNNTNNSNSSVTEKNPQTYDGIMTWIVIGVVSVSGIVGTIVYKKKQNI